MPGASVEMKHPQTPWSVPARRRSTAALPPMRRSVARPSCTGGRHAASTGASRWRLGEAGRVGPVRGRRAHRRQVEIRHALLPDAPRAAGRARAPPPARPTAAARWASRRRPGFSSRSRASMSAESPLSCRPNGACTSATTTSTRSSSRKSNDEPCDEGHAVGQPRPLGPLLAQSPTRRWTPRRRRGARRRGTPGRPGRRGPAPRSSTVSPGWITWLPARRRSARDECRCWSDRRRGTPAGPVVSMRRMIRCRSGMAAIAAFVGECVTPDDAAALRQSGRARTCSRPRRARPRSGPTAGSAWRARGGTDACLVRVGRGCPGGL